MTTHNLVGTASNSVTTPLGYSDYDSTVINPSRTQRRESSCEYRSTHISRSAYDTSFIGSQFRSVIEIRLFTQNCLVVIDPAYHQKLRVGVFFNTDRQSLRAVSQGYLARSRYECDSNRMAHLSCVGEIIENFMSGKVRQPTAMLNNSREGHKQITGKQNNLEEMKTCTNNFNNADRMQIEENYLTNHLMNQFDSTI